MLSNEYRNNLRISQSQLKWILYGAEEYRYQKENPEGATEPKNIGSSVHILLLQPHLSHHVIDGGEEFPSALTKVGKVLLRLQNGENLQDIWDEEDALSKNDKIKIEELKNLHPQFFENPMKYFIFNSKNYQRIQIIVQEIKSNADSSELLKRCTAFEKIHLYNHKDIDFKAQLDGISSDFILDLKTTRTLNDERAIRNQIFSYDYHFQAASYMIAAQRPIENYFIIFARTEPPYSVFPVQLSRETLEEGRRKFDYACDLYNECLTFNPEFNPMNKIKVI